MSLFAELQSYALNLAFLFLNDLEDVVRQYLKDVKAKVLHMKKVSAMQNDTVLSPVVIYLFKLSRLPLVIMYYIYIMPFLFVAKKFLIYSTLAIKIVCRRSPQARHVVEHIIALFLICRSILLNILKSKFTELIAFCIITIYEIVVAVVWPADPTSPQKDLSMALSVEELAEVLAYEEVDADGSESTDPYPPQYHRSLRGMHHYIPSNPFKATIRIHHRSVPMTPLTSVSSRTRSGTELVPITEQPGSCLTEYMGIDSPASFPPTPFSRANVMSKALDRVASVMFAARDRLRLEAQSVSRDEYTRMLAMEAQTSGQFAVFDPRQSSPGIALSCGNHCATKVGKGLCCCCCSMVPVRPNAYVYFEFSIMVSSSKTPTLGIGLSPQDCPTNVMVGSWPQSQGLYNDGQMLIGSHWHQSLNGKRIEAGSTVGVLVYLASDGGHPATHTTSSSSAAALWGHAGFGSLFDRATGGGGGGQQSSLLHDRHELHEHSAIAEVSGEHTADASPSSHAAGPGLAQQKQGEQIQNANDVSSTSQTSLLGSILRDRSHSSEGPDMNESFGLALSEHGNDSSLSQASSQPNSQRSSPERVGKRRSSSASAEAEAEGGRLADAGQEIAVTGQETSSSSTVALRRARESLFHFTVNGEAVVYPPEVIRGLREIAAAQVPLYPTVSLFSEETRVWCRFCEADIVYRTREAIGAPPGVRVYSLDGSLLLQETE